MRAFRQDRLPAGYVRLELPGLVGAVLAEDERGVMAALAKGKTLYGYAARHPYARELRGRGIAYAVPLPEDGGRVVIRHSRHGGALARFTGDRFFGSTRAPREIKNACRLAERGVPTPRLVAAVTYPAGPALRRSDIATREIAESRDLSALLALPLESETRRAAVLATGRLLAALTQAGARHPDLNLTNVLCARDGNELRAYVIDVDTVVFRRPGDRGVLRANLRRLRRSARKWQARHGIAVTDADIQEMETVARSSGNN